MAHHMWLTKPRLRPIGLTSVPQGDNASAGLRQFTQTGQADLLLAELDVLNQTGCVWRGSPPPPRRIRTSLSWRGLGIWPSQRLKFSCWISPRPVCKLWWEEPCCPFSKWHTIAQSVDSTRRKLFLKKNSKII